MPWLKENWSKNDIHFFRDRQGRILLETISLDSSFYPKSLLPCTYRLVRSTASTDFHTKRKYAKASLISLGILVLELWFDKSIDSCAFRTKYSGPDGCENEFATLNTARVWQSQALEAGGIDLDNLTYRLIHGDFCDAKQDFNDEELRKAVYVEVVQPPERILVRYELFLVYVPRHYLTKVSESESPKVE
jgi:hypothetical protein